jgi:hypothetical protein
MSFFNDEDEGESDEVVLSSAETQETVDGQKEDSEDSGTNVDGETKMILETNREILKVLKDIRDSMEHDQEDETHERNDDRGRDADLGVGL